MSDEEVKYLYGLISDYSSDMADDFLYSEDHGKWFDNNKRVLESLPQFTEKYKNAAQLRVDKIKALGELFKEQSEYKDKDGNVMLPTKERMDTFKKKHPGIGEDEIAQYFTTSNDYMKEYIQERKDQAARTKRELELKEWPVWKSLLASDYEKQRYLNDPNSAIFGEQAPGFLGSSAEAKGDLISGVLATGGDFVPGYGAVIGPTIRAGRDVAHKVTGSEYQKDWNQIRNDAAWDYGTNIAAWKLLNARKANRIANTLTGNDVDRALAAADELKAVQKGLPQVEPHMAIPSDKQIKLYREAKTAFPHSDTELEHAIMDMPQSPLKDELMLAIRRPAGRPINRQAVNDIWMKYYVQSNPYQREAVKLGEETMLPVSKIGNDDVTQFLYKQATSPKYAELGMFDKARYAGKRGMEKINVGWPGQIGVQQSANLTGRGTEPKLVETALKKAEREANIDRMISSYSLLWSKNNPPPEAKNSPLIMEAWKKWSEQE